MSYRLPPLNGLKAFEAAGRHLSFKRASEELSVTPGAVSQQVKNLEQALGVPLFQRRHRGLFLTEHGEAYLPIVSEAFDLLSTVTDTVARSLRTRVLKLGISPRLVSDPKRLLATLVDEQQEDFVSVSWTDDVSDLLGGGLDALLRPGSGPYPGMQSELLTLNAAFEANHEATLIVWPGLAECREYVKVKSLLARHSAE